ECTCRQPTTELERFWIRGSSLGVERSTVPPLAKLRVLSRRRQLVATQLAQISNLGRLPRHERLRHLEKHHRRRAVLLRVNDGVCVDEDQRDARVMWAAVTFSTLVAQPHLPVRRVE